MTYLTIFFILFYMEKYFFTRNYGYYLFIHLLLLSNDWKWKEKKIVREKILNVTFCFPKSFTFF